MKYNNYNISIFGYQDPDFIPKSDGDSSCSEEYTYLVLNITQTELGHKSTRQVKCDSQFAECDSQSEPNQAHYVMVGHFEKKINRRHIGCIHYYLKKNNFSSRLHWFILTLINVVSATVLGDPHILLIFKLFNIGISI